jgi:hypothetical protein
MRSDTEMMGDATKRIDRALRRTDMNRGDKAANGRGMMRMAMEWNGIAS